MAVPGYDERGVTAAAREGCLSVAAVHPWACAGQLAGPRTIMWPELDGATEIGAQGAQEVEE